MSESTVNLNLRGGGAQDAADERAMRAQLEALLGNYGFTSSLCRHSVI
jgi:hypothetical protein